MQTPYFRHFAGLVRIGFLSLGLVACSLAAGAAAALPTSGQFDEVSTIIGPRVTIKITKTVTFKGNNYRLDSQQPDMVQYSRIMDNGTIYSYLPDEQTAMRMPAAGEDQSLPSELLAQKDKIVHDGTKSGTDTVSGFPCDIYTAPLPASAGATVRIWVSKDPRFPFIVKTQTVQHKDDVTDTEEITNVRLNTPISDAIFALPKDTKVVDAPQGNGPDNSAGGGSAGAGGAVAPAPQAGATGGTPPAGTATGH